MNQQLIRKIGVRLRGYVCLCFVVVTTCADSTSDVGHNLIQDRLSASSGRRLLVVADATRAVASSLTTEGVAAVVIVAVGALATAAGAGGGALFVPLFSSLLHFSVRDATSLSQAVITGGAVAGTCFALFQKHPTKPDCPLIQFDLALVLIPSLLLGTSIGVLLNRIFPVWLITLCLIVILTYLTYKTTAKGMQLRLQEQVATSSQSAHSSSLQAVQVDQEPDDTHTNAVHSLLRSISDKPDSPLHSSHADKHTAHSQHKSPASLAAGAALPPVALADVKLEHLISTDSLSSAPSGKIAASSVQDVELVDVGDMHAGHMSHQSKIPMHISHNLRNAPRLVDEDEGVAVDADRMPLLRQQDSQGSAEGTTRAQAHAQMSMLSALPNKNFKALSQLPGHKIIAAVVLWIAFATLQLLKAATARCSTLYWLLYTTQACAAILASVYFIRIACSGQSAQSVLSSEHEQISQSTEPEWTHKVLTMASAVAVAGGAMAGTVGMGGGVVMGPLLLYLQVPPAASAATSTLMILFSSSAATLSFAVDGQIHAGYAITYASLNFVSSFLGVFLIGRAVKRTGKSSTIVLLLAFMMAAGAFISAIFGEVESIQDIKNGRDLTFNTMCS